MEKIYLMAVDLGTTFIKAAVYDTEGTQISSARAAVISDSSRPGVFLQSGTEIYRSVLAAMKSAAQTAGSDISARIGAIGFTGQMAGFMGVDRDWNDITSWSCSLDTRYVPYANEQMRTLKQQFLDICGTNAPLMSAKCKWFVSDFPEEASKVAKYMLISSYVIGHTWSHTKAHFYRALLESFAYELRGTMDSIAHMYPEWNRFGDVKIIGGGASSDTWRQILADVTGCSFLNYSGYDAALWGTAVLAGKGIGLFDDLKSASGAARLKGVSAPIRGEQEIYEKYMAIYEQLTAHMHPICEKLLAIEK